MNSPAPRKSRPRGLCGLLLLSLLMLSVAAATAGAQPKADTLLLEGRGEDYWICLVTHDPQQKETISSVRQRVDPVAARWQEVVRLQARVTDMAAAGDRLALLTEDGDLRLTWPGGGTIAPAMPGGRRPTRLASAGQTLWAIGAAAPPSPPATGPSTATRPTSAPTPRDALLRWDGSTWMVAANLPDGAPATSALAVYDGIPWLAYPVGDGKIAVVRLDDGAWTPVHELPSAGEAILITNSTRPLAVVSGEDGGRTVFDLAADAPVRVQSFPAGQPWDIGVVTGNLRAISFNPETQRIQQSGYYDLGRGAAFGPEPIAHVVSAGAVQQQQQWMQIAIMGLMMLAMILTLRTRPAIPAEVLDRAGLRLAPLGRRVAAGLIDALPYIVTSVYVSERLSNEPEAFDHLTSGVLLLTGMAVYLVHVTVAEMIWGRSLGKAIFGLRVVMNDGSPLTPGRAVLRNIMRVLDVSLFIPLLFVLITPMRQRIGDLAAGTLVVVQRKDEPTELTETPPDQPAT